VTRSPVDSVRNNELRMPRVGQICARPPAHAGVNNGPCILNHMQTAKTAGLCPHNVKEGTLRDFPNT